MVDGQSSVLEVVGLKDPSRTVNCAVLPRSAPGDSDESSTGKHEGDGSRFRNDGVGQVIDVSGGGTIPITADQARTETERVKGGRAGPNGGVEALRSE